MMKTRHNKQHVTALALGVFFSVLILINYELTGIQQDTHDDMVVRSARLAPAQPIIDDTEGQVRRKRDTSSSMSYLAKPYPVVLGVPYAGCSTRQISAAQFPTATCFGLCHSNLDYCTGSIKDVFYTWADMVCTARIVLIELPGVSASHYVTKWIRQSPKLKHKYGTLFASKGTVDFDRCPDVQLSDSSTSFYMEPLNISLIADDEADTYYFHCEGCLSTYYADLYLGSLFLDLPTAMFQYLNNPAQRCIVVIQNPTDRVFSEYFYSYSKFGYTDLSTYGGQVLHDKLTLAINDVITCMNKFGPAPCVFGVETGLTLTSDPDIRSLIYKSCYSVYVEQLMTHIPLEKTIYVKAEELSANPESVMTEVNSFIGLSYNGKAPTHPPPIHKPVLEATITALDDFFSPFNSELSTVLSDDKWLFSR